MLISNKLHSFRNFVLQIYHIFLLFRVSKNISKGKTTLNHKEDIKGEWSINPNSKECN